MGITGQGTIFNIWRCSVAAAAAVGRSRTGTCTLLYFTIYIRVALDITWWWRQVSSYSISLSFGLFFTLGNDT